jgi:SAM-dependent methyltransferase
MKNSRLVEHYDQKYQHSDYATVRAVPLVPCPQNRFEMAVLKASSEGGRYLEIGAGSGNIALTVLESYDELVLTELSNIRTIELKKLFKKYEKVKVIQHNLDTNSLDYPSNYFDTVLLVAVVEHLVDPIMCLKELCRVLKPRGRLIIDTPNIAKWTRRLKLLLGYFPSTASLDEGLLSYDTKIPTDLYDNGHMHYFTFRSLSRLCIERCGFNRVERFGYGSWKSIRSPYLLCKMFPSLFSEVFIVVYK